MQRLWDYDMMFVLSFLLMFMLLLVVNHLAELFIIEHLVASNVVFIKCSLNLKQMKKLIHRHLTNTCVKFENLSPVLETDFYTLTWTPASQTRKCINKWEKFVETESEFSFSLNCLDILDKPKPYGKFHMDNNMHNV